MNLEIMQGMRKRRRSSRTAWVQPKQPNVKGASK